MASLDQTIGAEIRRLRENRGVQQEAIAAAARSVFGLEWTRGTVTAIELGRRGLSPSEVVLLPLVLAEADVTGGRVYAPWDLIPDSDGGEIDVAPGFSLPFRMVRNLLGERRRESPEAVAADVARVAAAIEPNRNALIARDAAGAAETKVATALGVPAIAVARAARDLWGHSLTAEREARIERESNAATAPRRLQALRGHITRQLVVELTPTLAKKVTKGRRTPKKRGTRR